MAARYTMPIEQLVNDSASSVASGWKLNFYSTGTTTRKDTFSDNGLTTANANPVVADSAGRWADIFLESGTYKVVLTDADDVEKWTADPVVGSIGASGGVTAKTAAYTVVTDDATKIVACDASSAAFTVTLPAAATATDGFAVGVKKTDSSVNTVTIDADGSETIDGATTYLLTKQYDSVLLRCDGSNWHIVSAVLNEWTQGADIASASPLVHVYDGTYHDVTGTTGFSAITVAPGTWGMYQFDGALTMTHGASLDLPGELDITTAAGDRMIWFATAASTVQVLSYSRAGYPPPGAGMVAQKPVTVASTALATHSTALATDDTIPQNTEGDELFTAAITPRAATNRLVIDVHVLCSASAAGRSMVAALFQDTTAGALAASAMVARAADQMEIVSFQHEMAAGTTSATTFKVRVGNDAGSMYINGISTGPARVFGGVASSRMTITEYWA